MFGFGGRVNGVFSRFAGGLDGRLGAGFEFGADIATV